MRARRLRTLLLAGLAISFAGLILLPIQLWPGSGISSAQSQSKHQQTVDVVRARVDQAVAQEKANPTKEAAIAVDEALESYNRAVQSRITTIKGRIRDLEQVAEFNGKTAALTKEIETFEAELREIQTSVAGPTPTVVPETEPNDTAATANSINLNAQPSAILSAAINPGGDLDFFTFTAPAGSRIWIETDTGGTQNAGATSRDTVIDLLAADGTTVVENDDDDGTGNGGDGTVETGLASMIGGRTLTAGGTYFIRVRAFSATGIVNPYRLFVLATNVAATPEVEANNTAATANTIVTNATPVGLRSGSIGVAGDVDYYSVEATAGNVIYFNTDADPERDGTGTDLVVEFRDPSDVLLLSVDSSITGSLANPAAEGANFTISTSGTYFIRVRHFSATGTGTYDLMVAQGNGNPPISPTPTITPETEPNNTAGTANVLDLTTQPCAIVSAAINPAGDVDFFTFTGAPAGSRIWIETDTGGTQNAGATSRDTVIDLLAADGTTVIENDDDDGTGNGGDGTIETGLASMVGGRTLTAGGTYFIRVRAFSATAIVNPYRLFVVLTNTAPTSEIEANDSAATANQIVTAGSATGIRSGAITAGDADYYSVEAVAGNIVYFNTDADPERDGTGTDLVVEFRDPSDVLLLSVDSSITGSLANPAAEGANFTITTSGTYFVRVRHFSASGTGTYHLMVTACSGSSGGGSSCTLTCPANISVSNDLNQCGAVVNYPAPTSIGTCGTITCTPASGSFFPIGATTVTCSAGASPTTCTFTITVNDTQPPSITCPTNVTVVAANPGSGQTVNYPAPTASDNCSAGPCVPTTITESSSQAITALNSVSCNDGVGHTDNSYWRAFSLASFGISNAFNVQSVDIGIESASANNGGGGTQPVTVRLYTSNQPFPTGFPGSLTMIGSATVNVADQSGTILNIPVTGTAPPGSQLVVEFFTPDGTVAGNLIFIGSNAAPETGPSYLSAADCGVTTPTPTASLGFPNMHVVMNVNGCAGGGSSLAVVCVPASGSLFPTGTTTVTCTAMDGGGNTATCSFSVSVFDVAIQDDGGNGVLTWDSTTGVYKFCARGGLTFTGTGTRNQVGQTFTLVHNAPDRRLTASFDNTLKRGAGTFQHLPSHITYTMADRDVTNSTFVCPP